MKRVIVYAPYHEPSNNYYDNTHSLCNMSTVNSLHIIQICFRTIYKSESNYHSKFGAAAFKEASKPKKKKENRSSPKYITIS